MDFQHEKNSELFIDNHLQLDNFGNFFYFTSNRESRVRCKRNFNPIDMVMVVNDLSFVDTIRFLKPLLYHTE
jgi:hypothetical protein